MLLRLVLFAMILSAVSACSDSGVRVHSIPDQPRVVAGHLHGQRVCDEFRTTAKLFNFTCAALPTNVATGWQLTPLDIVREHADDQTQQRTNLFVALDVTTPAMTKLKVMYNNTQMQVVDASPHVLPTTSVGHQGEYVVSAADDGTHKYWTLIFRINPCLESSEIHIFNMSLDGAARSNPLSVIFLRSPDEVRENCGGVTPDSGAIPPPVTANTTQPTTPTMAPQPGGPCHGQPEQQFMACEICAQIPTVLGVAGCSFAEAVQNYNLPNAGCSVSQVTDANQCSP